MLHDRYIEKKNQIKRVVCDAKVSADEKTKMFS